MVLVQDHLDRLWVLECEECKTARTTGRVAHNGALINVTVSVKVSPQAVLIVSLGSMEGLEVQNALGSCP